MVGIAKIKKVYECLICRHDCFFHFYGVRSCEGCKQFFRRVVIKHLRYECQKKQQCDIIKGDRCRGCRLDKCLLMGMDPKMVQIDGLENDLKTRQFIDSLEEKQREMWQENGMVEEKVQECYASPFDDIQGAINFLVPLERAYSRIWSSAAPLPNFYRNRHANMDEFLNDNGSQFLQLANTHFPDESSWDKATWLEQIENHGFCDSNYTSICAKDWYLCFEGAKVMPFFKQLEKSDQIALMGHIVNPVNGMCGAYIASRKGVKTLTRANGLTAITLLEAKQFRNDQRLQSLYQQICNSIVEKMIPLDLGYEEYLLLFALAFLASNATGLSQQGRDLIYAESVRYTQALHKLLQTKFGTFLAAQKFAAAMNLLEFANRRRFLLDDFVTHLEYFYEKKHPMDVYPKAIQFEQYP